MQIVYTSPSGRAERVFLSGVGEFRHGVPREVHPRLLGDYLGPVLNDGPHAGRFERNVCFGPWVEPTLPARVFIEESSPVADVVARPRSRKRPQITEEG